MLILADESMRAIHPNRVDRTEKRTYKGLMETYPIGRKVRTLLTAQKKRVERMMHY